MSTKQGRPNQDESLSQRLDTRARPDTQGQATNQPPASLHWTTPVIRSPKSAISSAAEGNQESTQVLTPRPSSSQAAAPGNERASPAPSSQASLADSFLDSLLEEGINDDAILVEEGRHMYALRRYYDRRELETDRMGSGRSSPLPSSQASVPELLIEDGMDREAIHAAEIRYLHALRRDTERLELETDRMGSGRSSPLPSSQASPPLSLLGDEMDVDGDGMDVDVMQRIRDAAWRDYLADNDDARHMTQLIRDAAWRDFADNYAAQQVLHEQRAEFRHRYAEMITGLRNVQRLPISEAER